MSIGSGIPYSFQHPLTTCTSPCASKVFRFLPHNGLQSLTSSPSFASVEDDEVEGDVEDDGVEEDYDDDDDDDEDE